MHHIYLQTNPAYYFISMMTEERGLRSANAKLMQDKKALERRVADLEEEIKVRCRNYMNIIERMRRGEVVERVVYERSADKVEGSGEKVRNGFGSPERIRNLLIFPVMELKLDMKIPAVPGIGKAQDKSKQKQEIGEKRTSQVVRKVEKESKEVQTDVVNETLQKTRQQQGLVQGKEQIQTQKPQSTVSPKLIQPVNQVAAQPPKKIPQDNSTQTDKIVKNQDSRADQTQQSITITVFPEQTSLHQLQNQPSTKSSSLPPEPPTFSNISPSLPPTLNPSNQLEQLKSVRLQLAQLDLELAKHKALHSALLNYKPSPLDQLNHFERTKSIPADGELLATAKSLEMKVEVVLVKLGYFEKILGKGKSLEDGFRPIRREMELLLTEIEKQSEQSRSKQQQLQTLRKLLQQTSTQRDRAQHLYQSLTTQHSSTQQQLEALQLRIRQSKAMLSTPRKTQTQRTSSRNSSNQKSVPMARHHMIMFNKPECKECAKLREQLASEREEVIGKCSLEMGAQAEKYERDVKGLRDEVDGLREELAKAKGELEKGEGSGRPRRQTPEFAKTSSKEHHLTGSPPVVGVRQRQLSLANLNTQYIKRSFTRTKTMRKTISVQKHTLSNLSQIHQSLRQKIGNVRQKLQKLRDTDGPRGQIEQLEKIDRKLTKLGARCGVVTERISERSEDSQETETEIIEVRFESPGRSDRLRVVENRRRGGAGEQEGEGGRANRFDFRKKNTLPES